METSYKALELLRKVLVLEAILSRHQSARLRVLHKREPTYKLRDNLEAVIHTILKLLIL